MLGCHVKNHFWGWVGVCVYYYFEELLLALQGTRISGSGDCHNSQEKKIGGL